MRLLVTSTLPRAAGVLRCFVERDISGFARRVFPTYSLFVEPQETGCGAHGAGRLLLAARKRSANVTANYLISLDARDLSHESPAVVGKVRSNYIGTSFTVYDNGAAPGKRAASESPGMTGAVAAATGAAVPPVLLELGSARRELAAIRFAGNVLTSRGPRKMRVAIPRPEVGAILQPAAEADWMTERMQDTARAANLLLLTNREPKWSDAMGAYVLNFNGRVTSPSVKNFQLVELPPVRVVDASAKTVGAGASSIPDTDVAANTATEAATDAAATERVALLFGRVDKNRFTLDLQWPLSPLQAFAIALTSLDYKLGCE